MHTDYLDKEIGGDSLQALTYRAIWRLRWAEKNILGPLSSAAKYGIKTQKNPSLQQLMWYL